MGKHRFKKHKRGGGGGDTGTSGGRGRDQEYREKGVRLNYEQIPKVNEAFEKFYKMQKICPEEEWDEMMRSCREPLPSSFRITGSRSEAKAMLHIIENQLIKDVVDAGKSEGRLESKEIGVKAFPLPWYPDRMAWQLSLTRNDIRRNEAYFRFHNFLISETGSGNISRQEAVSMIPPFVLGIKPHHKVLDMCASPGSKTAQIIEMLHAEDNRPPEGYVVANDVDNKRCYMLVHQGKRLQSPAFVVTNHDASKLPNLYLTGTDGEKMPMKFDRVLCDVPCSGDGTIRKNIDVWKKWNPSNSLGLQHLQYPILKRGIELLAPGGLLVYSTCSLNPQEDEAVVHRMLKEAKGSVQLLDIDLPHLKYKKGISHWTVCDRELNVYDKLEDVPQKWASTIHSCAFPPPPEEAASFHLDKCVRILPHQQDTGGFFVALMSKTKPLPWETPAPLPVTVDEESNKDTTTEKAGNGRGPSPPKKSKRMQGFKEDPYIFMSDDHEIWPKIKEFYELDGFLKSTNFLRRTEEGKIKNLYLTSEGVRNFVMTNDKFVKIINVGVKALARIDDKWSSCKFRLSQEGLPSMCSSIKGRRIHVTKEDLIIMLEQSDEEKAPLVQQFSTETQAAIKKIERGSLVLICDFQVDNNGPRCYLELVGWKGEVSLRVYIQKADRVHYLRLCGKDISKYEVNKFKAKEEANNEVIQGNTGNGVAVEHEGSIGATKSIESVPDSNVNVSMIVDQ